jgi:predicted acetyltransferase
VVLHIDTQTTEGREKVAGIVAVGTLPGHLRRGMSTELMEKAHELSQERGIRISFLLTSSSLVAHEMYVKLGYKTLDTFDRGFKQLSGRCRKHHGVHLRRFKITDAPKLDRLFTLQTEDRLGFIYRQDGFIAMKVKTRQVMPERIKVAVWRNKTVGYIRIESEADFVSSEELVGLDDETRHGILEQVENLPSARWAFCYALGDARISQVYRSRGYNVHKPGFGRVMATCLDSSLSGDELSRLYGVYDDRFVIYSLDTF